MKSIKVAAAIIRSENANGNPVILATQRGYGAYKDWWEFPGGKVDPGETSRQALVREIREELAAEIVVEDLLISVEYDYPEFHLSMDCFWCRVKKGQLTLLEHEAAKWLDREHLRQVKWLPADIEVLDAIEAELVMPGTESRQPDPNSGRKNRCAADTGQMNPRNSGKS